MDTTDSSSEEHSSTESSTESSEDDKLETVQICENRLQLPQGLCERKLVFDTFFSPSAYNELSDSGKQQIKQLLPNFPQNNDQEKSKTLQKLFNKEVFRFSSPLDNFYEHLKAGHYRPDIAKMRYLIRKAEQKESRWRYKKYREKLEAEVMESRQNLINQVSNLPPGVEPRLPKTNANSSCYVNPIAHRTKRRYFQILSSIRAKVEEAGYSSDENYPDGPPVSITRKQKRHLNSLKNSHVLNGEKIITSTMALKPTGFDLERNIVDNHNPFYITEDCFRSLVLEHKKRKYDSISDQELDTKGNNLSEIIQRTRLNYNKKLNLPPPNFSKHHSDQKVHNKKKMKKEYISISPELIHKSNTYYGHSSNSDSDSDTPIPALIKHKRPSKTFTPKTIPTIKQEIKQESIDTYTAPIEVKSSPTTLNHKPNYSQYGKITPATLSDLDGIDMMNIPIDLEDSNIDILDINNKAELMQDTHANFLSLIRDIICSTNEHRMNMSSLEESLKAWQENPITALNDWYCLTDNWVSQLQSAVHFLSGNFPEQPDDFVPYIEFKPQLIMYQWIGAGRDSDSLLAPLCNYWLDHRNEIKPTITIKDKEDVDVEVVDTALTPPPPRCPTNWTVRKPDLDDIRIYREQERKRYDNPHKSFTFRCNGYEGVVGPLKGIYNQAAGNTKARGHTVLIGERPNFVTILSLVKDAAARLPNGEGTRAEICELLKCSQYISPNAADSVVQSVVSGALDRLHTQFDPCVKYDPKRKIWIYLHRNRSEDDFDRLHQQHQGMNRQIHRKPIKSKTVSKPKVKVDKIIKNNTINKVEVNVEKTKVIANKLKSVLNVTASATSTTHVEVPLPVPPLQKQTSLLLPQTKLQQIDPSHITTSIVQEDLMQTSQIITPVKRVSTPIKQITRQLSQEEKEINEALQAIVQNNSSNKNITNAKVGKSLVKIITSNQGKSLIIPTNPIMKTSDIRPTTTKVSQATQQLLQTLAQQKQINPQQLIRLEIPDSKDSKLQKSNLSIQQQILQSISPQQLQNIKNVTLLRNVTQRHSNSQQAIQQPTIVFAQSSDNSVCTQTVSSSLDAKASTEINHQPIRVQHSTLTLSQQQQILQTLKQKGLPIHTTNIGGQQQMVIRHKGPLMQKTLQSAPGTSLLGQSRIQTELSSVKPIMTAGQGPLVAKVLTNAAGQVISVESLLAHQKQHGTLPQGTTLRVSGVKGGTNIIQLAPPPGSKGQLTQLGVSQNNYITLTTQPKLVLSSPTASATTTFTSGKPLTKTVSKTQTITKFPPKVAQQIINAKFITQSLDAQKLMQPKVILGQNQIKLGNKTLQTVKPVTISGANANSIRMMNATNLNIAHISGKPVLLASKGSTLQNIQGQNVLIQTQANSSSGLVPLSSTKNNAIQNTTSNVNIINQSGQVVITPQLKVQPQVLLSSGVKNSGILQNQSVSVSTGQILVGGQPLRLQTSTANTQRVVLASQGQGGQIVAQQILLPAGFQGTAINIKSLQGVKVIPIAQAQQGKGMAGRQVFARVVNPQNMRTATINAPDLTNTTPTTE